MKLQRDLYQQRVESIVGSTSPSSENLAKDSKQNQTAKSRKNKGNVLIKKSKFAKTMKKGGELILSSAISVFSLCLSILQFTYYITAIQKNTQLNSQNVLTIPDSELDKLKKAYPVEQPILIKEDDLMRIKNTNPKLIQNALDQKYIKKIKRKNTEGETVEGYTLAFKGKNLIKSNIENMNQ